MGSVPPPPRPVSSDLYDQEYLLRHCGGHELYAASGGLQLDERLSAIFELAQIEPGMRVLDVGCGRGELTLHGGLSGGVTWGVDLSTEAVRISLETLRMAPKGVTNCAAVLRATALRLPFHNGHFHRVFLSDILEHLLPGELSQTLGEVHRVIRDDGCAVFHTFPNRWFYSVYYPLRRLFWEIPKGQAGPRNPRTIYERRMHVNELSPLGLMRALKPFFRTRLWCAHRSLWNADSGGFRGKSGPFDWIAQPEIWGIGVKRRRAL